MAPSGCGCRAPRKKLVTREKLLKVVEYGSWRKRWGQGRGRVTALPLPAAPPRAPAACPQPPGLARGLTDTTLELSWSKSCRWWKELQRAEESWGKTR